MHLLTFTSLYPNAVNPGHGVFVENRLVHLVAAGHTSAIVVAPVPWFPSANPVFGRFAEFARVPRSEERHGIEILHPRYPTIPGIGALFAPLTMAIGARAAIARLIERGERFDAIDAHYFFPDGVAAAMLARWFKLPLVITARGSDINLIAQQPVSRRAILWAARVAGRLVTVSRALHDELLALGVDASRVVVLRNGVDAERFTPLDRVEARRRHRIEATSQVVVSVGRLHAAKGHDLVIEAIAGLPDAQLLIVGGGSEDRALRAHAEALGVAHRVRFLGQQAHDELASLYAASDVLVLASSNEGWPNVLLEAMACGTPVVATNVGGVPEIVTSPEAGRIIDERSPRAIEAALRALFADPPDRAATRRYAERYSWDETSRGQERLFESLLLARSMDLACKVQP
ncbi:MAG: glycosyltransferase family 4 protein [Burkholderiaceae bacterium]